MTRFRMWCGPFRMLVGLALLGSAACKGGSAEPPAGEVQIHDAWARPVEAAASTAGDAHAHHAGANSAVYLNLRNTSREADRLVGVESPVSRSAEIHHSQLEDGIVRMRRVDGVSLGAGETVEFRPGGLHLMLIDVKRPLHPGDHFPLVLNLEKNGAREVEVEVRVP
jgi:periplasmic copper chaperone A